MTPRSIRIDHPVDPVTVEILRAVAEEAQAEGIDYMLVGATARDILLTHVFGISSRRATYDMDFAVAVKDWHQFDAMKTRLIRVYQEEGVIEAGGYDPDLAGVYLLGKDIQRVASAHTSDVLKQIIERDFDRLVREMIKPSRDFENVQQRVEARLRLLQQAMM